MKPEDFVYREWREQAKRAVDLDLTPNMRIAAGHMADALQRLLQDMSPYGNKLVFP